MSGLKLSTSSGGSVSIEPANTASNYTLTVPAQTGTVVASDSNGQITATTVQSPATTNLTVKAPDQEGTFVSIGGADQTMFYSGPIAPYTSSLGSYASMGPVFNYYDSVAGTNKVAGVVFQPGQNTTFKLSKNLTLFSDTGFPMSAISTENANLEVGDVACNSIFNLGFYDSVGGAYINGDVQLGTSLGVGTGGSGTIGEIRATNNITAYYSSDRTLKENIKDVENPLAIVSAIGSKTFDWTDEYIAARGGEDGYFVQKSDFGVVAQDVQAVFPQAVRTRADGTLAVDYEKLATLSFGAINQLLKRIEALEAK